MAIYTIVAAERNPDIRDAIELAMKLGVFHGDCSPAMGNDAIEIETDDHAVVDQFKAIGYVCPERV